MNKTPRQRLRTAIESFLYHYPMFANIVLKWELVEVTDRPTMATDGRKLLYNPNFVTENTLEENAWVILHEAGHVFLGHHIRLVGMLLGVANIAFDLALNELIKAVCPTERLRKLMVFVGKGDYADFPPGKDAETYYATMTRPESPQNDQGETGSDDPCPDTSGQSGNATDEPGENGEQPEESPDSAGDDGQGDASDSPGSDSDGQGVGESQSSDQNGSQGQPGPGKGQPGGQSDIPYQGIGEILPSPDIETPEDKAKAEGEWQEVVAESLALGKMCGNCPGWFKALGEKLLGKSEIPWTQELRQFLTKVVPKGATFSRPNRRSSWRRDVILPARRSKGGTDGLIIADVSGSIFDQINEAVMPEIERILISMSRTTVDMAQVDTEVRDVKTFRRWDFPLRMPLEWKGGGGTNLNPGFEYAMKNRAKYKFVVVVTDFVWPYQGAPNPKLPVLWIGVGNQPPPKPKFGRVVKVKE